jgi:hypothetical protein
LNALSDQNGSDGTHNKTRVGNHINMRERLSSYHSSKIAIVAQS